MTTYAILYSNEGRKAVVHVSTCPALQLVAGRQVSSPAWTMVESAISRAYNDGARDVASCGCTRREALGV